MSWGQRKMSNISILSLREKLHNLRENEENWSFLDQHTGAIRNAWLSMALRNVKDGRQWDKERYY